MRSATASLLGRLMAQPLHGPRVALLVGRALPPGLVAALADGPGDAALTVGFCSANGTFTRSASGLGLQPKLPVIIVRRNWSSQLTP